MRTEGGCRGSRFKQDAFKIKFSYALGGKALNMHVSLGRRVHTESSECKGPEAEALLVSVMDCRRSEQPKQEREGELDIRSVRRGVGGAGEDTGA